MEFAAWMLQHHYSASTVSQTIKDLKRVGPDSTQDPNVLNALRRYATYAAENDVVDVLSNAAAQLGIGQVKRLPKLKDTSRKLEARSFEDEDWNELTARVANSSNPSDQVIGVMCVSALRIGDALRIGRRELRLFLEQGGGSEIQVQVKGGTWRAVPIGVQEPWERLARGVVAAPKNVLNVAQYVCPGAVGDDVRGSCAYYRVHRRLKTLQRTLGLSGRSNSHRIRRTIAVKTLELHDLKTAQNMLGHRTSASTQKYVDEVNVRKLAKVQRKIAGLE